MEELTLAQLKIEAQSFAREFSTIPVALLYGVTDGKAVGTYIEQAFHRYLIDRYSYIAGSSASGIDLPLRLLLTVSLNPPAHFIMPVKKFMAWAIICLYSCTKKAIKSSYALHS